MAKEPCYMKAAIRLASSSMVTSRKVGWRSRKGPSGKRVAPFVSRLPERTMLLMKKCPFCAEDIQDQAIVCKHCKHSLTPMPQPQVSANAPAGPKPTDWKKVLMVFGIIILIILSFQFWYLTIPGAAIWHLWKKTKFSKRTNAIATAVLVILFAILEGSVAYAGRAPTLTITDPQNNYTVQAQTVTIKGKVSPATSALLVNGSRVQAASGYKLAYFNGWPISHVKETFGHNRLETTRRYYLGLDKTKAKEAHGRFLNH